MNQRRKIDEADIRTYVKQQVLPIRQDVDEEDAVTLLTLVVETGMMNSDRLDSIEPHTFFDCKGPPREIENFRNDNGGVTTTTASRKRITYARIGCWASHPWEFHTPRVFELLAKLDCLQRLCLRRCTQFRLTDTLSSLPSLKHLEVTCSTRVGAIIGPLDVFQETQGYKVSSNLEKLQLNGFVLTREDDLATFLLDVLPFVPKLVRADFEWSNVHSFQAIAQRIRNSNMSSNKNENESENENENNEQPPRKVTTASSRLRILNLGKLDYNRITKRMMKQIFYELNNNPMEIEARKTILVAFRELQGITIHFAQVASRLSREEHLRVGVDHLVEMNFAGRVLVERTKEDWGEITAATITGSNHAAIDHPPPPIPLSVWPKVLERAWKRHPRISNNFCTGNDGIYYLLQNVPALLHEGETRS